MIMPWQGWIEACFSENAGPAAQPRHSRKVYSSGASASRASAKRDEMLDNLNSGPADPPRCAGFGDVKQISNNYYKRNIFSYI